MHPPFFLYMYYEAAHLQDFEDVGFIVLKYIFSTALIKYFSDNFRVFLSVFYLIDFTIYYKSNPLLPQV